MPAGVLRPLLSSGVLALSIIAFCGCGKKSQPAAETPSATNTSQETPTPEQSVSRGERSGQKETAPVASPETKDAVKAAVSGRLKVTGKAHIGVLYYLDRPAHRLAVLDWLKKNKASVQFESEKFGFVDADLDWQSVADLIATSGDLGLDEASFLKLEVDSITADNETPSAPSAKQPEAEPDMIKADANSPLSGEVHNAGYGARVVEFRKKASADLHVGFDDIAGQGIKVAVFDGGIDLSRTDVFQNRLVDFLIGEEKNWQLPTASLNDFRGKETAVPAGLSDVADNPTLRFTKLSQVKADLNGSGAKESSLDVAVYLNAGKPEARFRPAPGLPFGDAIQDFGDSAALGRMQIVDLYTGQFYKREPGHSPSAAGVKFRLVGGIPQIAFVGMALGADHGMGNLHMVGGNYLDTANNIRYQGVAPQVNFIGMQTWNTNNREYGAKWIPLARSMIQAADAGADVLDLDIYTPGSRGGIDLLSGLTCRITSLTNAVPVVAVHNYGPLPDTIQSLAQSPCVLGIGASHSLAAMRFGRFQGSLNPRFKDAPDDAVQTADYSGRGFGLNGMVKPDIISPAYGYVAAGAHFVRFAGTSGATPTTAGMIALLKQAARLKKVELNFAQVKGLLQGSSLPTPDTDLRDGYGFSNLEAAWNLFLTRNAAAPQDAMPVMLTGQKNFQFEGRPNTGYINISLGSMMTTGNVNAQLPMSFSISYGGASAKDSSWLKFVDLAGGNTSPTYSTDMPMVGESEDLKLLIDLSDAAWAALPPGDHIAIVKGVRSSLSGGRNVDFMFPVSFVKPLEINEAAFSLKPLYAGENSILQIATRPGDILFLYGSPSCFGNILQTSNGGADAPELVVDNQSWYDHASNVMNGYDPAAMGLNPVRVIAKRNVVNIGVVRQRQYNCDGAVGGQLSVRRLSFAKRVDDVVMGARTLSADFHLTPQGESLMEREPVRGTQWQIAAGKAKLQMLATTDVDSFVFKMPAGVVAMRVTPKNSSHFQAILSCLDADGKTMDSSGTVSTGSGGFASLSADTALGWTGLEIKKAFKEGDTLRYEAFAHKQEVAVELTFAANPDASIVGTNKAFTQWLKGEVKTVSMTLARPDVSTFDSRLGGLEWHPALKMSIGIQETLTYADESVGMIPLTLWETAETFFLP